MGWEQKKEMGRRDVDIRKKVEHAFPHEQVHVMAQFESLCHSVHLERLSDELDSHEQTR